MKSTTQHDNSNLTEADKELLKKLETESPAEIVKEECKSNDKKYNYYYKMKYDVDPDLGLIYKDYDLISKQRTMVFTLIKQIGSNILHGKSIMNVSFPVYVFEPFTLLDRFADLYTYVPTILNTIIDMKDPLERMNVVLT